jgi:pyruvate dehydrogenase E2 component (dihydrolipoamide acetyltransferase)
MFAYAAVQALKEFPAFRSSLKGDDTIRTYDQVNLGVAVALPGDELVIAVVDGACQLSWKEFALKLRERIELARNGVDQAHEGVSVSLTNMQAHGIRDAVAVVVPPSVATVFLGEPYWGPDPAASESPSFIRCANLGITFDHRLINGVGAALFQNRIKQLVETIGGIVPVE